MVKMVTVFCQYGNCIFDLSETCRQKRRSEARSTGFIRLSRPSKLLQITHLKNNMIFGLGY